MNDRYDAGDEAYGAGPYELVGYDEYGRPVYRQVPAQQAPQAAYDPYAQQQGYGHDPYATGQQPPAPDHGPGHQAPAYDPYGSQTPYPPQDTYGTYDPYAPGSRAAQGYDPYGQAAHGGQQPRVAEQTAYIPHQAGPAESTRSSREGAEPAPGGPDGDRDGHTGGPNHAAPPDRTGRPHETEPSDPSDPFAFAEDPDGDSEDVIDWLKFTENRTERREEARRRARGRIIALLVVLAVVLAGGVGYLWYAGDLPGQSSSGDGTGSATPVAAQKRDVIVVHLHNTGKGGTSTALLVDNTTTKRGTTVLLPNALALTGDDGPTTTLAKSVAGDGASGTRDQLDTVLGTNIQGSWRLDTPYLQNLVELVGNIEVDTDTDVPDPDAGKKGTAPLVHKGHQQTLGGKAAVAYATYRAAGESQDAQLARFGQVMQGVLRKMPSDPSQATTTVQTLAQILDPPLTDKDLGSFLARLADLAKNGAYRTTLLPVGTDGTLSARTGDSVVKDVLGGTAKSPGAGSAVRVSVQNATGVKDDTDKARVVLLNGGFTFLEGGSASGTRPASSVLYADAAHRADATEVAKTLGLPAGSVTRGTVSSGADVSVVLGGDYRPSTS